MFVSHADCLVTIPVSLSVHFESNGLRSRLLENDSVVLVACHLIQRRGLAPGGANSDDGTEH